jgi:hypothetical protein
MIAALKRAYASFRGFDDETGTVPMMDGPLRPNKRLDDAPAALAIPAVDNLVEHGDGLLCSSGPEVLRFDAFGGTLAVAGSSCFEAPVSCLATEPGGGLAVGLDGVGFLISEGPHAGRKISEIGGRPLICPTAAVFAGPDALVIACGSTRVTAADWKRDLMERGSSGAVWRVDLRPGAPAPQTLAEGLAFPSGLAWGRDEALFVSESWRHRVIRLDADGRAPRPAVHDLPAYPGRISAARDGGFWLALFAPRNQLVEFVLRENGYRRRMIDTVDPAYWIAPALSSGASFLEPIQGGARKKLNMLKPWSPSWSYGLVAHCNDAMRLQSSFHSRADGRVHGVGSCCERDGVLYVAAKGSGVIVAVPLGDARKGIAP